MSRQISKLLSDDGWYIKQEENFPGQKKKDPSDLLFTRDTISRPSAFCSQKLWKLLKTS